jgi:hypothetical protein
MYEYHEGMWGIGSVDSLILKLGTKWDESVFVPCLFTQGKRAPVSTGQGPGWVPWLVRTVRRRETMFASVGNR